MKTYKIEYLFDGCTWHDYVESETPEQAAEYLKWINKEKFTIKSIEESMEIATFYCPTGWTRPESVEMARIRSKQTFLKRYLPDFYANGKVWECEELKSKLLADGWIRTVEDSECNRYTFDPECAMYSRGYNEVIYAYFPDELIFPNGEKVVCR